MAKTRSIRRSLLENLLVVIVLLSGAIMATMFSGSRRAVQLLSRLVIRQAIERTEVELQRFFEPVVGELQVARAWGEAGVLDLDDPELLRACRIRPFGLFQG